ncbi:Biotin carboxylase of acetyl-CoA carboxylase [hydrothermal vent metagenome]|uniref:Biotin carboxylase of acetyl-CoA carboxylase n=1 Tax=hydrothermal vent metagenome TaxID=652676 RepID=A0A3B0SFR3_9ZZZZ
MAFAGVETTIPLFIDLVDDPEFCRGDYNIHWLEEWLAKEG